MKIFLDANVLVSVLNHEYPVYSYSSRILSLSENSKFKLYTSPLCLSIAFYFAEKKSRSKAKNKIASLSNHLTATEMNHRIVNEALRNKQIHDFEDGMQYYSAVDSGCRVIVTEDSDDFYFSDLEVLTSREFLTRYVF